MCRVNLGNLEFPGIAEPPKVFHAILPESVTYVLNLYRLNIFS